MAASYPSAVKSFSTKATNDVIQASHINDLQDEVTALENALLNTLAHDFKFTDGLFDIGKAGATRPRDGFFSRNLTAGGTLDLTGAATLRSLLDISGAGAGQISFPAAQNASAGANVLDDYEEGTWTPVVGGAGGTSGQTYTVQTGHYVKVGRLVTCWGHITTTNKGVITGILRIEGLPFVSAVAGEHAGACQIPYFTGMGTSWASLGGIVRSSVSVAELRGTLAGAVTGVSALTTADLTNTIDWVFIVTYLAAN